MRQCFDQKQVSPENQTKLLDYYYSQLSKAVDIGYNPKPEFYNADLAKSLRKNIAEFSAFKETSFRRQLEALLAQDGKIASWPDFKKKADALNIDYNKRWLKAEYHQTVARANMAEKWQGFVANADLYPNLKIVTAGDGRVRESHKALEGLTLPVNHPYWKKRTPPFDWGCRCTLVQTDQEPSQDIPEYKYKKEHENNPYYSGEVFSVNPYAAGLSEQDKGLTRAKAIKYFENKTLQSPRAEQFKIVQQDEKGKVLEHLLTTKGEDYNDILTAAKEFFKQGRTAELLPEIHQKERTIRSVIFPNLSSKTSNPDLRVGNWFYDIKRPKAIKNILGNANKASGQGAIAIISDSQLDKVLTDEIMLERARDILESKYYQFDVVCFLRGGELIILNRTGV